MPSVPNIVSLEKEFSKRITSGSFVALSVKSTVKTYSKLKNSTVPISLPDTNIATLCLRLMNKNNTKTRFQIQEEYIEWDLNQMTEEDLRDFFIVTQNRELNDLDDDELVIEVKQYAPQLVENITLSI